MGKPQFRKQFLDYVSKEDYIGRKGIIVASVNKKKKAKNSYLYNGGDKNDDKMKRIMYFTKRQRIKNKKIESFD